MKIIFQKEEWIAHTEMTGIRMKAFMHALEKSQKRSLNFQGNKSFALEFYTQTKSKIREMVE